MSGSWFDEDPRIEGMRQLFPGTTAEDVQNAVVMFGWDDTDGMVDYLIESSVNSGHTRRSGGGARSEQPTKNKNQEGQAEGSSDDSSANGGMEMETNKCQSSGDGAKQGEKKGSAGSSDAKK